MKVSINGREYLFVANAIKDDAFRDCYFDLAKKVFGLDFGPWYRSGFCDSCFVPYTLFADGVAVSSVGVVLNDFVWRGSTRTYAQISTVATDPDYRLRGLGRWLTEMVLNEWTGKCDCIYLYANDSVVDYYPKFGFAPAYEYRYHMPFTKKDGMYRKKDGMYRKLDLSIPGDVDLLIKKHKGSNPFSSLTMQDDIEIMMFHCITFLRDCLYYVEKYDAVVVAEMDEHDMFCYDVYSENSCDMGDILGVVASEGIRNVTLGFTPKVDAGYTIERANEDDTTVFVLEGTENIFADNMITLPFLSRA